MAPMIDMVFLLLVFFMTVSNMAQAQNRVPLELPESEESRVPEDLSDRVAISVNTEGAVFFGATPVELDQLATMIEAMMAENPELRMQVRADAETPFREVRKVLKTCAAAGAYNVIYSTYEAK